ncbi:MULTISPECIES: hypothetical protein [unclassified Methylobacterium]|uniref:hypothetical protein n=1 Tax=unclassified Methylobacterium TaxID=2615210 RepID=UPI00135267CA|nr:hypothetical protein [Methylobacterium sp. 2A]MWV22962.1 hypothetical protein [Methylobacterium sp. 2A]
MIVLLAVALSTGLLAMVALLPLGFWAAVIGAPLVASSAATLAGGLLAWRTISRDRQRRKLEAQTGVMVSALRDVTHRAEPVSPAPKVAQRRLGL